MTKKSEEPQSPLFIHHQFIKDLSFENFIDITALDKASHDPKADIHIETNAKPLDERRFEVSLSLNITAQTNKKKDYLLELVYSSVVSVHKDIEESLIPAILMVHVPTLLFPYVRNIVSETTATGGFQPIYLQPVDFGQLFAQQQELAQKEKDKKLN